VPHRSGGVDAAMKFLEQRPAGNAGHLKVVGS
jgi:alanine-glyoxylate transaminase/serine-glyoxylate transaminase/serine-pyruvate transaminase